MNELERNHLSRKIETTLSLIQNIEYTLHPVLEYTSFK